MTMCWVQIISRKDQLVGIPLKSSETICQIPTRVGKDIVRTAWRHAESGRNVHSASLKSIVEIPCKAGGNAGEHGILRFAQNDGLYAISGGATKLSEIPCRVSSDLHEWRNESATVLPTDTANL